MVVIMEEVDSCRTSLLGDLIQSLNIGVGAAMKSQFISGKTT